MVRALFRLTLFLSAGLLFWIQPVLAKMLLPLLGGAPAVWNTCLFFYQGALLVGYLYAHLLTRWLPLKLQGGIHLALLGLAALALPVQTPTGWSPPLEANPIPWLLVLLAVAVGGPFTLLSATAPLLQNWFGRTDDPDASDPYFLYAASNLGSLGALLGYPLGLEPTLTLGQQSRLWAMGYGLLTALIALAALVLLRSKNPAAQPQSSPADVPPQPTWGRRLRWLLLAAAPSSLLMGLTTHLSTDLAAVPLLWIIPLTIYLLTFVLVFARRPILPHGLMVWIQPPLVLALIICVVWQLATGFWVQAGLNLATFFVTAMVCHGELVRSRPSSGRLTEFYLFLSLGGLLGGAFNALLAPLLFTSLVEYPLVLLAACWLRPWPPAKPGGARRDRQALYLAGGLTVALAAWLWILDQGGYYLPPSQQLLAAGGFAVLVWLLSRRPLAFGLGLAGLALGGVLANLTGSAVVHIERNFYGVLKVRLYESRQMVTLSHGTTLHGAQSLDPERRREPLSYYFRGGPAGDLFKALEPRGPGRRVAVVGLGAGALAAYGQPGEEWVFYELNPAVLGLAKNNQYFNYLSDCQADLRVILGDARLSLVQAPPGHFDLIVVDAFSSDSIPVHLLTKEAIQLYLSKLKPQGRVALHISNQYLDLQPVIGRLAGQAGLASLVKDISVSDEEDHQGFDGSTWAVVARTQDAAAPLATTFRWDPLIPAPSGRPWTDDFSNIVECLKIWERVSALGRSALGAMGDR